MKSTIWILILLQLQLYIEALRVDHEQTCDTRFLPKFDDCLCDYEDRLDDNKNTMHDLVRINCTDLGGNNVITRLMLSQLSEHLTQTGYTHLEELIFVGNDVAELPTNLVGRESLAYLEKLDLSNNGIKTIKGKTFHSMPILNELILDNNEWHVDPRSSRVFSSIFNIEILSLNNAFTSTDLASMHVTALSVVLEDSKLDYLRKLYLENNRMLHVSADVFQRLPSLEYLSLAHNNINTLDGMWNSTCIPSEYVDETLLLDHRCPLKTLDLSSNQITTVSEDFIDQMKELKQLEAIKFADNPFICDCHLLPFYDFVIDEMESSRNRVANNQALTCAGPSYLEGRYLISLTREELACKSIHPNLSKVSVKEHHHAVGIVFAVLISIFVVVLLIALFINKDAVKRRMPIHMATAKRYLPWGNKGYKEFELNDDKVEPVGV